MKQTVFRLAGRFRRLSRLIFAVVLIGLAFHPSVRAGAAPADVPSQEPADVNNLLLKAREKDGSTVKIVGEVIGESMLRGEYAWINVLDAGGVAIGIYLPASEAAKIEWFGSYAKKGDTVAVVGVFRCACPYHAGEPDIHAEHLAIVGRGGLTDHQVSAQRRAAAVVLLALASLAGFVLRRKETDSRS